MEKRQLLLRETERLLRLTIPARSSGVPKQRVTCLYHLLLVTVWLSFEVAIIVFKLSMLRRVIVSGTFNGPVLR